MQESNLSLTKICTHFAASLQMINLGELCTLRKRLPPQPQELALEKVALRDYQVLSGCFTRDGMIFFKNHKASKCEDLGQDEAGEICQNIWASSLMS